MSRAVKLLISFCLLSNLIPDAANAFGAKAHKVAGYVAEARLCDASRQAIAELIPGTNLAEAGLWADRIRSDREWDVARPWHYMNVPDDVPVAQAPRTHKGDVLIAINYFSSQLANRDLDRAKRTIAFYLLVHFIVDIHQPLHVGRKSDLGGNLIQVWAGHFASLLGQSGVALR